MNNTNNNTIDSVKYSFYNIETGIYNAYFNDYDICYLSLIKGIKTKIPKTKYIEYKLNKNDSYLIYKHIKNLKPEIIKISDQYYYDYNIELISEIKSKGAVNIDGRKFPNYEYREIYIKINNEEPLLIYRINGISELKSFNSYIISSFYEKSDEYFYIITPNGNYYINDKVEGILKKYFKCEDGKIVCMYNNKKEIAKLTLITEDYMDYVGLLQSLELEINNKKFTFYVNRFKYLEFGNRGVYKVLIFHIHHDSKRNTNQLLGYEPYKNIYYDLTYYIDTNETKFILNNINQEIAKKFKNEENINIYTYINNNNNNENYGLIYTKNDYQVTSKKFAEINTFFEKILDISLLKPVDEWDNEEINAKKKYYEKEYKDNIENNPNEDNPNEDTKDNIEK